MYKTVLLPTDFTINSLNAAKKVIDNGSIEKIDFVFIHGIHLTDSISDLLFFSKDTVIEKLSNEDFKKSCILFQELYAKKINSLKIELFTGFTQTAFNNLLSALKIDEIYLPEHFPLTLTNAMSADLTKYLKRANIEKTRYIDSQVADELLHENQILHKLA